MSSVGLLYVGIVLFVNGVMLLGHISGRGAAPINFFVGALQIFTPTYLIVRADGDPTQIALAAGLYLFGFTYLWVGLNAVTGWPAEGLGWFSLTVAACAIGFALHSWLVIDDQAFAVIWALWAILWFSFFLLMGLHQDHLTPAIGVLTAGEGIITAGVPAFLLLVGWWEDTTAVTITLAVLGALLLTLAIPLGRILAA
ncbi:MAG TPA: AmiS/UreI family transporter, partial [Nocardioidaceae bacterium]|nr:AmiS/UreI family transporter [Nocardioidaceae bacterium]